MRILLLFIFILFQFHAPGQNITYNIPDGYEKNISKADYKNLVDISVIAIKERYQVDYVKDGEVHLKTGQDMQVFNLHNLIHKCALIKDNSKWKEIIKGHFANIFLSFDEQKNIEPENFESIKKYLSVRIYPKEMVSQRGGVTNLIYKIDLSDTYTLLMLDLPGTFNTVPQEMFVRWKKDPKEVFTIAQNNVNKQQIEKITKKFDFDSTSIEISFIGNEDYAASYALDLINNSPELIGEWGSVVAIPNKGLVDICKISRDKPLDFVKFIQFTKPAVEQYFNEHQQPVSDQFFWYYNGNFTKITVLEDEKGNINVISPMGLAELMTKK